MENYSVNASLFCLYFGSCFLPLLIIQHFHGRYKWLHAKFHHFHICDKFNKNEKQRFQKIRLKKLLKSNKLRCKGQTPKKSIHNTLPSISMGPPYSLNRSKTLLHLHFRFHNLAYQTYNSTHSLWPIKLNRQNT